MNQTQRVLDILKVLQKAKQIKISEHSYKHDISERSAQKDFKYIKEFLGENAFQKKVDFDKKPLYTLLDKNVLDLFIKENYNYLNMYIEVLSSIDSHVVQRFKPKSKDIPDKKIYKFIDDPYEVLKPKQKDLIKNIENYIFEKKYVNIIYTPHKTFTYKRVKPLKIIFIQNNWYLATIESEDCEINDGFKLLRIQYIESINESKIDPYTFHRDEYAEHFIENRLQTTYTSYKAEKFLVKIKVSHKIARFFKAKRYLKTREIINKNKIDPIFYKKHNFQDGDLLVEYKVTNNMEVLPIVQKFLPDVKILEPKELQDEMIRKINVYLTNSKNTTS